MINLCELRVVEDTFFKSDLCYYKPSIHHFLERHFKEENDYSEATLIKLKNLAKAGNVMAYNTILKEDIRLLQKEIEDTPKQFDEQLWRDMLPKIRQDVKKVLGMDFKPRSVFFQEAFPAGLDGFEQKGASSITVFEGNKDAGIYFLNKRVSSFFTPILMIHEQLHSCLSQNKSKEQIYIEWFEEGLAQWYSLKIYYDLTKNFDVLQYYRERAYVFSRVKEEHNFTKRYYEYMKIFARLYLHGGEKLIGELLLKYLANEREEINSYLGRELAIKSLPKDRLDNFLVGFAMTIEPEKVPPVEYLVLKEVLRPAPAEEISKRLKVPPGLLNKVLFALHAKGMIVAKGEDIEINWRKKDLFDKGLIRPYWPLKR